MNQVNCPVCGKKCAKSGKTKAESQRWFCKKSKTPLTHKIGIIQRNYKSSWIGCLVKSHNQKCLMMEEHLEERHQNFGIYGPYRRK